MLGIGSLSLFGRYAGIFRRRNGYLSSGALKDYGQPRGELMN